MRKVLVKLTTVLLFFILISNSTHAAGVPVHDPSIIIVYKDASGNSFNSNDTGKTRTKYYYIFGTMLGAAYSTDLNSWTAFTPTFNVNGSTSTDYYTVFKSEADYAGHASAQVQGNLWAPDVIYNTSMNKWCMYFSLSGNEFKSSIILLTADKIEGPYTKVGDVAFGGFTNKNSSIARTEYNKVMGTSTIPSRYLMSDGNWNNDYSVSCIDPYVTYDESGKLWMSYGSWSGGIYLLKLSETTGLRDYSYNYNQSSESVWDGTRLRYDKYFGYHIAGGYYVSGEGSYIEYIKDANGVGYYYMFISNGFYSPEGGYTMRVYRSSTINGVYKDISGTEAVFDRYVFNYGNNTTYGFPIIQNYKWNWWPTGSGEVADGHNSQLQDEDGNTYLIYHRKMDNGEAWHNVEVHQLLFNDQGWIVAAPFEYRKGYELSKKEFRTEDIAGLYGTIEHAPTDYANLAVNTEKQMYVNADGTVTGAFTGTWSYSYSNGKQYITLTTSAGTFRGVISEYVMNDISSKTIAFTAVNPSNERALWGYRHTNTVTKNSVTSSPGTEVIGAKDYSMAWDAYSSFHKERVTGDFEVEYTFTNNTLGSENWHNWAVVLENGSEKWYLRGDAWSNSTFTGSTVEMKTDWSGTLDYKTAFKNKEVNVKISKIGSSINVYAYAAGVLQFTATSKVSPSGDYTVYLGGEACYLDLTKVSVSSIGVRQMAGVVTDGDYLSAFNTTNTTATTVSGDFSLKYHFGNYRSIATGDNWDNFVLRATSGGTTMFVRADNFVVSPFGTVTSTCDWDWNSFMNIMYNADVTVDITRKGSTMTFDFVVIGYDGKTYNYNIVNSNTTTDDITFDFTCEESMVDLFEIEKISFEGVTSTVEYVKQSEGNFFAPNPVVKMGTGKIITDLSNGKYRVSLYNSSGKICYKGDVEIIGGVGVFDSSIMLESGLYTIVLSKNGKNVRLLQLTITD